MYLARLRNFPVYPREGHGDPFGDDLGTIGGKTGNKLVPSPSDFIHCPNASSASACKTGQIFHLLPVAHAAGGGTPIPDAFIVSACGFSTHTGGRWPTRCAAASSLKTYVFEHGFRVSRVSACK